MSSATGIKLPRYRDQALTERRNLKMARSVHAYVRGNTARFYEWLAEAEITSIPEGPAIWICGDCHTGNLGPIASKTGDIEIQIRDLDQTVIGNPAHDLIRLGLSLATAARGSNLPGVITAKMIEALYEGYLAALKKPDLSPKALQMPKSIHRVMTVAMDRTWKHLARERLEDTEPDIPLGKRFWPLSKAERQAMKDLFKESAPASLASLLRDRPDDQHVEVVDAAYWVKGCSSLGRLRYAVLLEFQQAEQDEACILIDVKEGTTALAPRYPAAGMPKDNAERVVTGARHLSPHLGERMCAARLMERSVVLRELLPQDLKLELDDIVEKEATHLAYYLAAVVGMAHARQMTDDVRLSWQSELRRNQATTIDAPFWLWRSIVELVSSHEVGYLEHCRRYALSAL